MKNLQDIPKKHIFDVPEGYFERLPGIIQTRVAEKETSPIWNPYVRFSLRYALPVVALAVVSVLIWRGPSGQRAEDMLASVDSAGLVAFLEESEMTAEDLLENISLDGADADAIQAKTMDEIQVDEELMETLGEEFESEYF